MSNNTKYDIEAEATQIRQNYNFRDCEIDLFKLGEDLGIEIKTESKKLLVFRVHLFDMVIIF